MGEIMNKSYLIISLVSYTTIFADTIIINNKTNKDVYAAFYYTKGVTSERMQNKSPFKIEAGQSRNIERPDAKVYFGGTYDRDLYFDYTQNFPNIIQKGARHFVNLGVTRGNVFYIAENEHNELDGYNTATWAAKPAMKLVADTAYAANRNTFLKAPYVNTDTTIRRGNSLDASETNYTQQRIATTATACAKLINAPTQAQFAPRIAFCTSGGGYRAMVATAGFLNGAQKIGLLDATLYHAGLSGSTWTMAAWLQSGKSLEPFISDLSNRLNTHIKSNVNMTEVTNALLNKLSFNQPVSTIDIWGSLIAQKILPSNAIRFSYADLAQQVNSTRHPFPLFTAVLTSRAAEPKQWVEFTPYEVGSPHLGSYIPSWAFGRKFERGASSKQSFSIYPPAAPLSECIGIWGSAITVNMEELIKDHFGSGGTQDIFKALQGSALTGKRVLSEPIYNWNYGVPGAPLSDLPKFDLIDAGLDFNIPLPPLLRPERAIDIIIVFDASASTVTTPASQLKLGQEHAQRNNLKFPNIDYNTTNKSCSVHYGDPKNGVPTIIYMPVMGIPTYQNGWYLNPQDNGSFTSTENFTYSRDQFLQLSGLTEHTVLVNKETIIDAIKHIALQKGAQI